MESIRIVITSDGNIQHPAAVTVDTEANPLPFQLYNGSHCNAATLTLLGMDVLQPEVPLLLSSMLTCALHGDRKSTTGDQLLRY